MLSDIKFNAYCVRNRKTGEKARVHYSLDNRADAKSCVTVYDRDYGHALDKIFDGVAFYENDTDSMTDYFDKGRVRIFEGDALYIEARAAVEKILAELDAKREGRRFKRATRYAEKRIAAVARFAPPSTVLS